MFQVGFAAHHDARRRAVQLQAVGTHQAVLDGHLPVDTVESEALAEHIAEIKRQATRQALQADQAEQLAGGAGIELDELPLAHIELHVAAEGGVVQRGRRSVPADLALQRGAGTAYGTEVAQPIEQLAGVGADQGKVELRAVAAGELPLPAARQPAERVDDVDLVEPPDTAVVVGLHFEAPETTRADDEVIDDDIESRQFLEHLGRLAARALLVGATPFPEVRRQFSGAGTIPLKAAGRLARLQRPPP